MLALLYNIAVPCSCVCAFEHFFVCFSLSKRRRRSLTNIAFILTLLTSTVLMV